MAKKPAKPSLAAKQTLHEFIKARLVSHTLDDIRKLLGLVDLREGHFADHETIVETDAKGRVIYMGSPGRVFRDERKKPEPEPEPSPLDEAMDEEFEEEEFEEEDLESDEEE